MKRAEAEACNVLISKKGAPLLSGVNQTDDWRYFPSFEGRRVNIGGPYCRRRRRICAASILLAEPLGQRQDLDADLGRPRCRRVVAGARFLGGTSVDSTDWADQDAEARRKPATNLSLRELSSLSPWRGLSSTFG